MWMNKIGCVCLLFLTAGLHAQPVKNWKQPEAKAWYEKQEWLPQLAIRPDPSIDQLEFAKQYHLNKKDWDTALAYLKNTDWSALKAGTFPIDGDRVFVKVTDLVSRDVDSSKWESHHNYHDIHYLISGKEMIGITPVANVTPATPYDRAKDVLFYKGDGPYFLAEPDRFFIIFSNQAHRPFVKVGGYEKVKRIVIKVRNASQTAQP